MAADSASEPAPAGAAAAGVWLGVDVGSVRVGVARSDATGLLAFPLETVRRDSKRGRDLDRLVELTAQNEAVGVVVGMPTTLAGAAGASAAMAQRFGDDLARRITPIPIAYVDERFSTVSATRILRGQGIRGPASRAVVDQVAAAEILQTFLDVRRPPAGGHQR